MKNVFLLLLLFTTYLSSGQSVVKGMVVDATNIGMPGVNILEKGTSNGTITEIDGTYSLTVSPNATLVFSFLGYKTTEVPVNGLKEINITLSEDATLLDEIQIVDYGYGAVKKSDMTGSVASLGAKDLSKIPITNAAQAITGRLPGVNVTTTDGSPDADVVIRVRGGGSITQDNSPLYVVDGFIVSSIRDVPPSDIESINVLKDASATAIYGAQASNGVIVITTKRPKAGKITVSYNGFIQSKSLPSDRKYKVLDPYEYVLANYEYAALSSTAALKNFERFYGVYDDLELYKQKKPTDWQQELFGNPLTSQYHNLSVSGGSDKTKVSLSFTNNNDAGLLINNGFVRNVINFKLDQTISKKLTFSATARITNTKVDGVGTSGRAQLGIKDAVQTRPVNGLADDLEINVNNIDPNDDFASFIKSLVSPTELVKQDWRKKTSDDYILNAALNYDILKNLSFKTTLTTSTSFIENLRFYGPLTGESFNNGGNLPLGEKSDTKNTSFRWLNTLNYKLSSKGPHSLDVLLGQEIYSIGGKSAFLRSEDFRLSITPEELFANMTFGRADRVETSNFTDANRVSGFGRLDYQYNNKYLATFTMRGDASSKFSKENRLGFFPALALGWKISSEPFLANSKTINDLKLRISYGQTGNDRIDATATQLLFVGSTLRGPGFGNYDNTYYTPSGSTLYNPDLVWETTSNANAGLDFTIFNSKISGSLDYYKNTTNDLLLQSAIPSNTGFTTQWNNIGNTSNTGVELGINATLIEKSDFSLIFNFNIGKNVAKIVKLDGTDSRFFQSNWASTDLKDRDDFYLKVGGKVGDIYGYVTDGYYQTSDFASYDDKTNTYILKDGIANASGTVGNSRIRPGFLKLKDLNADGVINSTDRQVIGNTLPLAQGGFGLNAIFGNFDASAFFNWSYGNDVYNTGKIQFNQYRRVTYGNLLTTMSSDNRFTYIDVDGKITGTAGQVVTDLAQLEAMNQGKNIWSHASFGVAQATIHSWAVEDGSFIRLNNLNVGYTIPRSLSSKIGIGQLRFYLTGNNLKLWTKYSGYDPEVSTGTGGFNALTPGVDYSAFPRSRSYTFGVNVTF
ncbi:MAG: TonB-dependent receptor [Saprospiraceae bacterium]|nr:TonB-dependent receptor [Saprospiraceae bacterium]